MGWVVVTARSLYARKRPRTHCIGGWMSPRAGLDRCGKYHSHRDSIFETSTLYRVAIPTMLSRPIYIYIYTHTHTHTHYYFLLYFMQNETSIPWRNVLITPQLINSCSGVNNDMPNEIQNFQLLQKSLIIFKSYYGATEV